MCGRFTVKTPLHALVDAFGVDEVQEGLEALPERFNVAPTQEVPVVRRTGEGRARRLDLLRWGLVPLWARDLRIGHRTINARAETVATTPAFRQAFVRRRCLVLADGFYEWRREGTARLGHWLRRRDGRPFAMAGLWERWRGPDKTLERPLETCTIITTDANEVVAPIHDRMPVILDPDDFARWLDPDEQRGPVLQAMLRPCPARLLESIPVGTYVNDVRHEGPRCIAPYAEPPAGAPRAPAQTELFPG
ncbi:MAG: SOS response-associated peptidase [Planctomycetes bacterium]|nr:SOS response-associated peptidase [Planctomycetota bacterium]